jgi:Family of unknown function (DUF5947)
VTGGPGLRRFREPAAAGSGRAAAERCAMCGESIGPEHGHVADLNRHCLLCTCRACRLLFTHEGAGRGRYRTVPDRYRYEPAFAITSAQWDELAIPVGIAFLLRNSRRDELGVFYPSPAGAAESMLPAGLWQEILAANRSVADVADDVEALLLRRTSSGTECHLVPIDVCYELIGRLRLHWRGFDGGADAHVQVEDFFARLRERSR